MNRKTSLAWSATMLLATAALVLAACGGAATTAAPKPVIKLAENPWDAAAANTAVAKILLETKLGYQVEIVKIDENAQFGALQKGDLSASLEVWPSGHANDIANFVDKGLVENIGNLGPVGQIGWFTPTYVVDAHPDLATWEGLKKPENAALFKTAETGDLGQYLQGDPSWTYHDGDLIKNLGLPFKILQTGSEDAVMAQVDAAYQRKQPVVFYEWTPNWIFGKYKLTKIDFPKYTAACASAAAGGGAAPADGQGAWACDYPPDVLFKIADPKLKTTAPDAYQFLKNFNYSNDDQIAMIYDMHVSKMSAADAAKKWVDANETKWSAWLPTK